MKNELIFCTENEILLNREFSKLLNLLVTGSTTNLSKEDKNLVNEACDNYSIPDFLADNPDYITFENLPELMGIVVSDLGHSPEITEHMKRVSFEKIDIGRKSYIITNFGLPESAQKIITEFFNPKFKMNFTNIKHKP